MQHPILYSFRRCPYAMRARLAIAASGIQVEIREIVLKHKPAHMLSASPKGTVPVLITTDDHIIDESLDIMSWALQQNDPNNWSGLTAQQQQSTTQLIEENDGPFKHWLDKYKYADRHPEQTETFYRQQGELTLKTLEQKLTENDYLVSNRLSLADIALLPFIRQFASVDKTWFDTAPYPNVQTWLEHFLDSDAFNNIMAKLPPWQENDPPRYFPDLST
jgi:glutathione S-transferase